MGKKIILGICSSIAAYKSCDLIRILRAEGHDIHPVMTENAKELITPLTLETLAGREVRSSTFKKGEWRMGHLDLREGADLLLVAPATANVIGKFARGIADDLLSTTYLSITCPVLIAPAMNPAMWNSPAVQDNVKILQDRGVIFVGPDRGSVASGESGVGRLAAITDIVSATSKLLAGQKIEA